MKLGIIQECPCFPPITHQLAQSALSVVQLKKTSERYMGPRALVMERSSKSRQCLKCDVLEHARDQFLIQQSQPREEHRELAMSRPANRAKTHFLKNVDLSSILKPADPGEAAFTATKGEA